VIEKSRNVQRVLADVRNARLTQGRGSMSDHSVHGGDPSMADVSAAYASARRALLTVFGVVTILLAANLGEFWPFSIYPMFSRAGRPWTRSIVRELEPGETIPGGALPYEQLPGRPFALVPHGLKQNDVAGIASHTEHWSPGRVEALSLLFANLTPSHHLLLLTAHGQLVNGHVEVRFTPLAELDARGAHMLVQ
jgi:hypothetical protein